MTDQASADRAVRRGLVLTAIALVGVAGIYALALLGTPTERWQGEAQKILYIHAPSAWACLMAFGLVGVSSAAYLFLRDPRLDAFSESSAEVGLAFGVVMLSTGPLWGKPVWGSWWQWEPRLTLTLLLFLLFLGYRALRAAIDDPNERARYAAVVGILALVLVPFVHLTVYLFRTIHPRPVLAGAMRFWENGGGQGNESSLPPEMLRTLLASLGVFTLLYLGLVITRYGLARRAQEVG